MPFFQKEVFLKEFQKNYHCVSEMLLMLSSCVVQWEAFEIKYIRILMATLQILCNWSRMPVKCRLGGGVAAAEKCSNNY